MFVPGRTCSTTRPFLKIKSVGMPRTPKRGPKGPFWSTLIFATFASDPMLAATCSTNGVTLLQGPHHEAQK